MRDKIKLMPFFYPFFAIINSFVMIFVYFPLWLVGYWWCDDCHKRNRVNEKQYNTQHGDICSKCYRDQYGINIVLQERKIDL